MERLFSALTFLLLFAGAFVLVPYVATSENYQDTRQVSALFPIAMIDGGSPAVIRWPEYIRDTSKYREKLLVDGGTYPLGGTEVLTITRLARDRVALKLDTDDYTFWCEYTIQNGIVQPQSFRYSGSSVVFYAFLAAAIGTPILGWLRRRYMTILLRPRERGDTHPTGE